VWRGCGEALKPRQACSSDAATARRSICLRSSVVSLLGTSVVLLLRRARSCCAGVQLAAIESLTAVRNTQRCHYRVVRVLESSKSCGFTLKTQFYGPNKQQVQPAPSFF